MRRDIGGDRTSLCDPPRPAAIQQPHPGVAVIVERPPEPRRDGATVVVHDHQVVISDPEPLHERLESLRASHAHVDRGGGLHDVVGPIHEHGTGNVALVIGRALGQIPGLRGIGRLDDPPDIHHPDSRVVQPPGEPIGLHQQRVSWSFSAHPASSAPSLTQLTSVSTRRQGRINRLTFF